MTAILTSIFVISRYISPILFDMKQIWPIFQNRAACTIMCVPPSLRIETAAYEKESYMFPLSKYFGSISNPGTHNRKTERAEQVKSTKEKKRRNLSFSQGKTEKNFIPP